LRAGRIWAEERSGRPPDLRRRAPATRRNIATPWGFSVTPKRCGVTLGGGGAASKEPGNWLIHSADSDLLVSPQGAEIREAPDFRGVWRESGQMGRPRLSRPAVFRGQRLARAPPAPGRSQPGVRFVVALTPGSLSARRRPRGRGEGGGGAGAFRSLSEPNQRCNCRVDLGVCLSPLFEQRSVVVESDL